MAYNYLYVDAGGSLQEQEDERMDAMGRPSRDEFLCSQIKSNCTLYKVLAVVYGVLTIAAVAMIVASVFIAESRGVAALVIIAISLAASTIIMNNQSAAFAKALEEIGPDPTGIDEREFSLETRELIERSRLNSKSLSQLCIAYGILAATLFVFGAGLLALMIVGDEPLFAAVGGLMVGGSVLLLTMTITAFRRRKIAKRHESL